MWIVEDLDGTSQITALTSTPDAVAFDAAVNRVAADLAALGDTDLDQVRRAKAVGVLADPQHALDLHTTACFRPGEDAPRPRTGRPRQGPTIHVHVHTHTDAVSGMVPAGPVRWRG